MVRPFVYRKALPRAVFADVRQIKERIDVKMAKKGEGSRNVKLGTGGIREVEFLVQALQVVHGRQNHGIRDRKTVTAIEQLCRARLMAVEECRSLINAYWFLRDVEHKLQMVEEQQTHTLPLDPTEGRKCAFRMGYRDSDEAQAQELFVRDYERHTAFVHELFMRAFGEDGAERHLPAHNIRTKKKPSLPRNGRRSHS